MEPKSRSSRTNLTLTISVSSHQPTQVPKYITSIHQTSINDPQIQPFKENLFSKTHKFPNLKNP